MKYIGPVGQLSLIVIWVNKFRLARKGTIRLKAGSELCN